jgi:hypothetical protein
MLIANVDLLGDLSDHLCKVPLDMSFNVEWGAHLEVLLEFSESLAACIFYGL